MACGLTPHHTLHDNASGNSLGNVPSITTFGCTPHNYGYLPPDRMWGETQEAYQERNRVKLADWRRTITDLSGHVTNNPVPTLTTMIAPSPAPALSPAIDSAAPFVPPKLSDWRAATGKVVKDAKHNPAPTSVATMQPHAHHGTAHGPAARRPLRRRRDDPLLVTMARHPMA